MLYNEVVTSIQGSEGSLKNRFQNLDIILTLLIKLESEQRKRMSAPWNHGRVHYLKIVRIRSFSGP